MYVIELFLPLAARMMELEYTKLRVTLTERFGGFTAFTRSPAEGAWRAPHGARIEKDDIIIVEVMTETLDRVWWSELRADLQSRLTQNEILMRAHQVEVI